MTRRTRWLLIGGVVALALIELAVRNSVGPRGFVEVVNHGSGDLTNLRISADGNEATIDRIEPNSSGMVRVGARSRCRIRLSFDLPGSALSAVQFDDFDPSLLINAHEKYVVELTDNGYRAVREDLGSSDDGFFARIAQAIGRVWDGTP